MVKDDKTRIYHILDSCKEILSFNANVNQNQFRENRQLQLATIHLLEIIGEASNSISSELQNKYKDVPWKNIIGMRNRLIHGYFDINIKVVWQSIKNDIPSLKEKITKIIEIEHF